MKLQYQRITYRGSGSQMTRMLDYLWDPGRIDRSFSPAGEWRPATDVYQTADSIELVLELAGMTDDDIEVTLFEDVIVITGERRPSLESLHDVVFHEAGVRYGRFRAQVLLPAAVNGDRVTARYDAGMLRVSLPKQQPKMFSPQATGDR